MLYTKKGCQKCSLEDKTIKKRLSLDTIKKRLKRIAPEYNFDLSTYNSTREKITANCKKHGKWNVSLNNIFHGRKCPECAKNSGIRKRTLKQKDWIRKARKIHGSKYIYRQVKYKNAHKHVKILCKKHGIFLCRPSNHIALKRGCPECSGKASRAGIATKKRITQSQFISKIKKIYKKNSFDFSKTIYAGVKNRVKIGCKKHGEFKILPGNIYNGATCPECSRITSRRKRSNDLKNLILNSKKYYPENYNYSKSEYKNMFTPIDVICPIHGVWSVLPNNHFTGKSRCPKCSQNDKVEQLKNLNLNSLEEFVSKAEKVHKNFYDYTSTIYNHSNKNLKITCLKHGKFFQKPSAHLSGKGCPKCGREKSSQLKTLSQNEIIKKFKSIHGKIYDYSEVNYTGQKNKITIICKIHGKYFQRASTHLEGKGCPKCKLSKGEKIISKLLTKNKIRYDVEFKINHDDQNRFLRYDFHLPGKNVLIEYDGEQHFRPVAFGGMSQEDAKRVFKKIKKRDKRKNILAKKYGFNLIRIPFNKNVEETLRSCGILK